MKYSVIGTSWITASFIDGAALCENLELDAVYSRTREKGEAFAAENGAKRVFTDFNELIECDSDFIYIASPNALHYPQTKALLAAGKNVICEKPITVTAAEFCELCDIADRNGCIYFEAIMYMHAAARDTLKSAVKRLGNISSAHIDYSQLSSKYPALMRGELPNIFNPEMKTGALNDLGIYCVYPIVDIFGMPESITPVQYFLPTGADGSGCAAYKYGDKLVTVTYSKTGQSRTYSQIIGDKGTLTVDSISMVTGITLYDNAGNAELLTGEVTKRELMGNEARDMVRFITEKEKYAAFYAECREMNKKVLRCMEMMRTNR